MAFLLIAAYLSPLMILGENAPIRVHDNLDSNLAWYKVLANSGELVGSIGGGITQVINRLLRNKDSCFYRYVFTAEKAFLLIIVN